MKTRCERIGQTEIGIVEHNGQEFRALGASVNGRQLTGYDKGIHFGIGRLGTFCGATLLKCRAEIVELCRTDECGETRALLYRLTRGRFIVGYSLGNGMLFRGELLTDYETDSEAAAAARSAAEYWIDVDTEGSERFQAELAAEMESAAAADFDALDCSFDA